MATNKKKKPVSTEFNTLNLEKENTCSDTSDMSLTDKLQEKAGIVELSINNEAKQMIDASEKLAEENAKYANLVSELQDRIADYIQEISELKDKLEAANKSNEKITEIDGVNVVDLVAELKNENKILQDTIEKMKKISSDKQSSNQQRMQNNCYRRHIIDGYSSWN